jgi:outer membrane protein assembly factor BamB
MATPVTDGKYVWAVTFYGDAFCYDMAGKLVWKQWYGAGGNRMTSITSPILAGDLLIFAGCPSDGKKSVGSWMAVDKATGKLVWATPRQGGQSYTCASPTLHRVAIGGDATKPLDVLWCPTGQILRVSDGKVLAKEIGCQGNSRPWAVQGDVLVIENGSADGGQGKAQTFPLGTVAFRLKATDADTVTAEQLWIQPKGTDACRLVARNGILYGFTGRGGAQQMAAYDLLTGKVLKTTPAAFAPYHLSALAGSQLFAMDANGYCGVYSLSKDGLPDGTKHINRLGLRVYGNYDFFNQGSQPAFCGNRIFIRSYTDVYCLGDAKEPTRLSETKPQALPEAKP